MLHAVIVAAALQAASRIVVLDDAGTPVVRAVVRFVDDRGNEDTEKTGRDGAAEPPPGFVATSARVDAAGFEAAQVRVRVGNEVVRLRHLLPVVGTVRVATGSNESLHRLPVASSALDAADIRASGASTTDELLGMLPGFDRTRSNSAFTNYGQLRVSFSGAGNDRGLVLVDGIPAQDGFGGQIDWAAYPPGSLARAELLRGAGSALYGAGAIGGVLDLATNGPPRDSSGLQSALSYGSGDHERQNADAALGISGSHLGASVSSSYARLAYDDLAPGYAAPSDVAATSVSDATHARVRYRNGALTVDGGGIFAWDAQSEGRSNYNFARTLRQLDTQLGWNTEHAGISVAAYVRTGDIVNEADQFPTSPGLLRYVQHVRSNESGILGTWHVDGGRSAFSLRFDERAIGGLATQDGPAGALQTSGSGTQQLLGLAAQETLRSGNFEALGGIRWDEVAFSNGMLETPATFTRLPARTDATISPRAAIRYDLSPTVAFRVSAGSGFRAPFLNELLRGYQIGTISYLPNPNLVPERSYTESAGVDWIGPHHRMALDVFRTKVQDAIMFETVTPVTQIRENVSRTQTDGATFTYTENTGGCTRLRLFATAQHPRVTGGPAPLIGKQLAFVPELSTGAAFDSRFGVLGLSANVSYLGQVYADDLSTQPLGAALVAGATVSLPLGAHATLRAVADNLTNRYYLTSVDRIAPPRTFGLSVRFTSAGPANQVLCR